MKVILVNGSPHEHGTTWAGLDEIERTLQAEGIECLVPAPEEYADLRECIEAVKQDKYTEEAKKLFLGLVNRYDACILGCTELPILYEKYADQVTCKKIYDPLMTALEKLKAEYDEAD